METHRPDTPDEGSATSSRQLPLLLISASIAAFPIYGLFVRAPRDPQWLFLVLLLTWSLAWIFAVIATVLIVIRPAWRRLALGMLAFFAVALGAGFFGLRHAFYELLAG